jgi:hypothetical protein
MFLRYWPTAGAFLGDLLATACFAATAYAVIFAAGIMGVTP